MGKKLKKKESDEENKLLKQDKKDAKDKKKGYSISNIIFTLYTLSKIVAAYYFYKEIVRVPEIPAYDLNKSWGPNTTEIQDTSIRPYKIIFSEGMEMEIRWLFEQYRQSKKHESYQDAAWTYGTNSEAFQDFYNHWLFKYKFRERARFLNKYPQYKTNIQGLDIHFVHVKPNVDKNTVVLPILLLHGWPGSIREFYEAISYLTTKTPEYDFVFEVIVPSLPGFGFSQATSKPGLTPFETAIIMRNLMHRLGHQTYYVQGGDFGHSIGSQIATLFPEEVLGFHSNLPVNFNKYAYWMWVIGAIWPTLVAGEHADRMYPLKEKVDFYLEEFGYMHLQGTKPDTIGIALQDSPAGLASYILDRFMIFTDPSNKLDQKGGLDKYYNYDKLLDNLMIYWISGSITTALRLYRESFNAADFEQDLARIPTPVPTWGLRFKNELLHSPDFILKWKYPNLLGTTNYDFGGHFAAFERPEEFSSDVFKAVQAFVKFRSKD